MNSLEQTIYKRLEWASGSSPNLSDTLKSFEQLRNNRNDSFKLEFESIKLIESLNENLINFEQLRSQKSEIYTETIQAKSKNLT